MMTLKKIDFFICCYIEYISYIINLFYIIINKIWVLNLQKKIDDNDELVLFKHKVNLQNIVTLIANNDNDRTLLWTDDYLNIILDYKIIIYYKTSSKCDFSNCELYHKKRHYHTENKIIILNDHEDYCSKCDKIYYIYRKNCEKNIFTYKAFISTNGINDYYLLYHDENCNEIIYSSLVGVCDILLNKIKHCKKCKSMWIYESENVFNDNIYRCSNEKIENQKHCKQCCITYCPAYESHCCICKKNITTKSDNHCNKCHTTYNKDSNHCCKCKIIYNNNSNHCGDCCLTWDKKNEVHCDKCHKKYCSEKFNHCSKCCKIYDFTTSFHCSDCHAVYSCKYKKCPNCVFNKKNMVEVKNFDKNDIDDLCAICMSSNENNNDNNNENNIVITNCQHKFHKECLVNWNTINNSCPLCRATI
jgi:hypothetical protein